MSVAAHQSEILADEEGLRTEAQRLADSGDALARPEAWLGYEMTLSIVEFWQGSPDRLHRRLRYDLTDTGWTHTRLQP
jgi:pyridoxamine 5'-phosphate oxidase